VVDFWSIEANIALKNALLSRFKGRADSCFVDSSTNM
jgi:hypothetical protein